MLPVWKNSWSMCSEVTWKPEQKAAVAVYEPVVEVLYETHFLADIASGEAWERGNEHIRARDEQWKYADQTIETLRSLFSEKRILSLDARVIEPLLAAVRQAEVCIVRRDSEQLGELALPLHVGAMTLHSYMEAILRHLFGAFGAYFLARSGMGRDYWNVFSDADPSLLQGVFGKRPFVIESGAEPLTANQKRILEVLDGCALKKNALAHRVYGDPSYGNILYRPHNLIELRQQKLVDHKPGLGFYRPDRPPPGGIPGH